MSKFSERVPLSAITPFNVGLRLASQETMILVLGRPKMPLSTRDQPDHASDVVKNLQTTAQVANNVRLTSIKALSRAGMPVVRLRRQPSRALRSTIGTIERIG